MDVDPGPPGEDLTNTGHAHLATGRTRPATSQPSGPGGSGSSPYPPGMNAESFMTPAHALSCRRQTKPETTPNLALSLTVPTLDPLSVGVGEGNAVTWVSASVFQEKTRALAGLVKGAEVYVEGRFALNRWTRKDGQQRAGLAVTVWEVMPLARIGRKRPKKPRPEHVVGLPFDDDLSF